MLFQLRHPVGVLAIVVAVLVGLFLHDGAQVLAAQALGDRTPRRAGRLTAGLTPRLDPFGAVGAVVLGYGWGSPVPLEERFRARRGRVALALAAGPAAYLVLCALTVLLLPHVTGEQLTRATGLAAYTFAALFVVALIPVPPLDGGRIVLVLAPQTLGWQKARYQLVERNVGLLVAFLVLFLPLLIRIPSVVGSLSADLLNGLGPALASLPSLGDAITGALGVP